MFEKLKELMTIQKMLSQIILSIESLKSKNYAIDWCTESIENLKKMREEGTKA